MYSPSSFTILNAPRILYLPDGSLVLCGTQNEQLRLSHMNSGESITLGGVFAGRFIRHLETPESEPFPELGPLARQHNWLAQLRTHPPDASSLLLGKGLGMLFIELTDQCNESCIHCYAESSPQRSARLSREEIRRVLYQARALGKPAVQFTGGDPLLHPDLVFAVQSARELDFSTLEIYTNGLALNESLLALLLPYRPSFAFSIYAGDAEVHDAITQVPGSLARTLKAMRRVQDAGLPLRVGIVLMAENRGTEDNTLAFLQQELGLDASQTGIDWVRSTGRGEFMRDDRPDTSRFQQFSHRADSPPEQNVPVPSEGKRMSGRLGKLCVGSSGDVFPCIFSRRNTLGNIRRQSLVEILASLNQRSLSVPSDERWRQSRESLSCSDCQAIDYLLGDRQQCNQPVIPIKQGGAHGVA